MKIKACSVCGSNQFIPLEQFKHAHLVKCASCNLVFSELQPEQPELVDFYSEGYDLTKYFSPITEKRYLELLEDFKVFRNTGKLLDIGCGFGFFLETAKRKGWDVIGLEITNDAVEACSSKGLNMHHGTLETAKFEDESFDVIVFIETIEHVIEPNRLIKEIHRVLRPGGLVYLSTPNFNALNRYRLQEKYDVIQYPLHLSYFTPKTLRRFFERNGFTTKKITSTGISKTRYKTSMGQSNQEYVSETSDDEMLRYRIENNQLLKSAKTAANSVLNMFNVGESIKGYFVKT